MTFIVKTITRRPAGVPWFGDVNTTDKAALKSWALTQTGLVRNRTRKLGLNTMQNVTVFTDQAAYEAFAAAQAALPAAQARVAYAEANGMVVTIRKFLLVE